MLFWLMLWTILGVEDKDGTYSITGTKIFISSSEHNLSANIIHCAHPFMEAAGDVIMAWMLLWRATVASQKLEKGAAFYEGQLKSAEFFINSILPITTGKMNAILTTNSAAGEISEDSFGS